MTPGPISTDDGTDKRPTEGVPQDQGQLRDLLALLAELEQGLLPGGGTEQLGNPLDGAAVVLGELRVVGGQQAGLLLGGDHGGRGRVGIAQSGKAAEVLLVGGRCHCMLRTPLVLLLVAAEGESRARHFEG